VSITLMAYPMAFLISPEQAKKEKLRRAADDKINEKVASKTLRSIRVLTNLMLPQVKGLMLQIPNLPLGEYNYSFSTGLRVDWKAQGKFSSATLYGISDSQVLQKLGEEYFQNLDAVAMSNVRLIDSSEFFYYNYETSYSSLKDIYTNLKNEGAKQIYTTADDEVVAQVDGQNVRYFKITGEQKYTLEVEQKVTIMNIGMGSDTQGTNVSFGGLTDLRIQTNIKPEELKTFLKDSNYLYYEGNSQTPLKNSEATLNWILKDGFYVAEFSGSNNSAIIKEAEILFRKMNIAAGRDLRLINEQSTIVYTYTTNYTDKEMLLNTLTEHGASEIFQDNGEISCKLFGMEMIYHRQNSSDAYTLDITQVSDKGECQDMINDLNEEYGLNIQEMTYNKIKERLDKENMRLESESVLEDNSIVLTIEV
jgi:hypothetical protein